jgi:iron complex outermembrane recepter protein
MVYHKNQQEKFKKSLLALCVMASAMPAFAQDAAEEDVEEVVVVGSMRDALGSAQEIKRNAATVVESITAKDLGSFPDTSVAEALQRVAGITVNRFAASGDTAHFSAEPSGVVVRGLNQVRTEFNGRDSFSANSSRGLSWSDVSSELMAGVDTYKNQMAELIEGGIAGSVNMRTRVPFDSEGQAVALTLKGDYSELAEEFSPKVSGLYSNRWETGVGEFGLLGNFAYVEERTLSQGNQLYRMNRFTDIYNAGVGGDGTAVNGVDSFVYIPAAVSFRDNFFERERNGIALAAQWKDTDEVFLATLQYNRSQYDNAWEEYVVGVYPADLSYGQSVYYSLAPDSNGNIPKSAPQPNAGYPSFAFDKNGLFQSGYLTADNTGWWGPGALNSNGQQMVDACYDWNGCTPQSDFAAARRGIDMTTTTRSNNNTNITEDLGFNLKWSPTDRFRASFDVQFVESTVENYDIETNFNTFADAYINLGNGLPKLEISTPSNVNFAEGGWTNPNSYYIRSIMDHVEDSEGEEFATRADFEFDVDSGWISSVKAGTRFADRDQTVRWSTYNWQNVSNSWGGDKSYFNLDQHQPGNYTVADGPDPDTDPDPVTFNGYPTGYYTNHTFSGDMHGVNETEFVFANMKLLQDQKKFASLMSASALWQGPAGTGWDPICSNTGDRAAEVAGTCFTPSEVADVSEETTAFYVQVNFGGDDLSIGDMPITGNIGVRYIETEVVSSGGTKMANFSASQLDDDPVIPDDPNQVPPVPFNLGYYLSAADKAFADNQDYTDTVTNEFDNLLPSLNIKLDINDEWLVRFAASKAMSRPDIGNLRSYLGVSATAPSIGNADDPLWIKDSNGTITGANVKYTASAQNPYLKPVVATQFDLAVEYYFDKVGSFTVTYFQKEFDDYIQHDTYFRSITNAGVTRTVEVRGPVNGEGAAIDGFELAYQRFFDFFPEPFDGLGIQANYTRINNDGISNTNVSNVGGAGTTITGQAPDQVGVDALEGLSEDAYNFVLMYEKGDWKSRLAYSWRSEYLQTAIDCCVALPIWTDDYGQVDGSLSYSFTENLEVAFEVKNLLNEKTHLRQQVTDVKDGGLKLPNAWHQFGTTYTLGIKLTYF